MTTATATANKANCNGKLLAKPTFLSVGAFMIDHLLASLVFLGAASLSVMIIGDEFSDILAHCRLAESKNTRNKIRPRMFRAKIPPQKT